MAKIYWFKGGGYTLRNVPRCWAYETRIAVGEELTNGKLIGLNVLRIVTRYA